MSTFSSFLGTLNNDSLTGTAGRDLLEGLAGNDTLVGAGGSDSLIGGAGNDNMRGGSGNDFYHVDSLSDVVVENANDGRDTVVTSINYTLGANVENLRVSNTILVGLALTGNTLNNGMAGGGGNDSLSGLGGNDQLYGYGGDDSLDGGEGNDTLDGGVGNDTLAGGNGNDYLRGGSGNDSLDGSSGSDTLDGGSGADFLKGGAGNQVYFLDDSGDVIQGETLTSGNDSIVLRPNNWDDVEAGRYLYDMSVKAAFVENLSVSGADVGNYYLRGNALHNLIVATTGNDVLEGGVGNDTLSGGDGNDQLLGGAGNDRLDGGEGDDHLVADEGSDFLEGGGGNDFLHGGAGTHTLSGGAGNDVYSLDGTDDLVFELADGGVDTVQLNRSGQYIADQNIEVITTALGVGAVHLVIGQNVHEVWANGYNDLIEANGNNWRRVYGLGGADTILGGAGSEALFGDFVWAQGNIDSIFYFNSESNDDFINAGDGHDTLIGGWGNDSLVGGSGSDAFEYDFYNGFNHMVGNDTLEGGLGSDSYVFVNHGLSDEGFGHDVVRDVGDVGDLDVLTVLNFSPDGPFISPDDVSFKQSGNNLVVLLNGSSTHSMTWENFFSGSGVLNANEFRAEAIQFADGINGAISTTWDLNTEAGIATFLQRVTPLVNASVQTMSLRTTVLAQNAVQPLSSGLTLVGTSANNTLTGGAGDDSISGLAGNDRLVGDAGNDTLDGGTGRDTLLGGAGDDLYHVSQSDDVVTELANEGTDWVYSTSSTYTLALNLENGRIVSTTAANLTGNTLNNVLQGNDANNSIKGGSGNDIMEGRAGNDTLLGELGNDTLYGGSGDDSLVGGDGDDVLDGGTGSNVLNGGAGDDVYYLFSTSDQLAETAETAASGTDKLIQAWGGDLQSLDMGIDRLMHVENYEGLLNVVSDVVGNALNNRMVASKGILRGGAGNDTLLSSGGAVSLYGDDGSDVLLGSVFADLLHGGTGADTMEGGLGNDQYEVDHVGDVIIELEHAGFDSVVINTTGEYQLGDHVESASAAAGVAFVHIKAGNLGSTLTGTVNSGDTLVGGAGGDWITGGAGSDSITGHAGSDTLFGDHRDFGDGSGTDTHDSHDTLKGGDGDDVLIGGLGSDLMEGGTGSDAFEYYYDDGIWKFQLDAFGMDTMRGGEGNDVYVVDNAFDIIEELANEGEDWVRSFLLSYALADHVEIAAIGFYEGFPEGAKLIGNDLSNTLYGNIGADTLAGGAGNDTLFGGEGGDEMEGGLGDDVFYVDSFLDFVSEWANEGTDKVIASVDYVMDDNVEDVEYATAYNVIAGGIAFTGNELNNRMTGGAYADTLAGNDGNDSLVGNDGNDSLAGGNGNDTLLGGVGSDVLNGGAGADRMEGGAENDTYNVDNTGDVVVENANEGTDTVVLSTLLTYTMAVNIENLSVSTSASALTLVGNASNNSISGSNGNDTIRGEAGNDTLNGGAGNDSLVGGSGNDVLSGGTGADRMEGGTENDTYHVDNAADVVLENANAGTDTVVLSSLLTYTLAANVENLNVGTSASAFTLTGNVLNNTIAGGSGHDTIAGEAGNDSLLGGLGNDKLNGGAGDDRLSGGAGSDTLTGGAGADRFTFDVAFASTNLDTIEDFTKSQGDKIAVEDTVFTKLAGKTNLSTHFRLSTDAAVGGDDFLVYNTATGQLFYDATGSSNNTSTMQLFAILSTKPLDLTGTDFVVI